MAAPRSSAASSSSSSSSSFSAPAASLSEEDLDRRLQQRLANLHESAAIHVSMPPPSAEQLAERLRRLDQEQSHSDEAELQRRFQRLNGQTGEDNTSTAASFSPAMYSSNEIQLAGHGAVLSEREEIDALLQQMQQQSQLEHGFMSGSNSLPIISNSSSSSSSIAAPEATASPPLPSRSEVAQLMRDLSLLPDTDILDQVKREDELVRQLSNKNKKKDKKKNKKQQSGEESESASATGSESETDVDVQAIINQAYDEARMER